MDRKAESGWGKERSGKGGKRMSRNEGGANKWKREEKMGGDWGQMRGITSPVKLLNL